MVQVLGLVQRICSGIDAGKSPEIMDKVGLIVVAAVCGDLCPIKVDTGVNGPQYLLETANTGKDLRRESYFIGKELDESARADADLL